jgi:hypothetical protein
MMVVRLRISCRWWVYPLIELAKFNVSIGIPVDPERVTKIIVKHGLKIEVEAE